jgi:hypothetical protein
MRTSTLLVLAGFMLGACSVPNKEAPSDGGVDTPGGDDDTGTPDTMIDSGPTDFSNQSQVTFEFSSNRSDATFECRLDGSNADTCTSPFVRTLSDGTHDFQVRAVVSGDSDGTPAERVWTIDTVAPDTTIVLAPPHADNSTTAMFTFTSNELNVAFDCSLDGGTFAECNSGDPVGPMTDGTHTFSVRARDRAGNVDASPAVYAWTIDTSTPDTQILTGPVGSVPVTTATFTFDSPDAGAGATFQCSLDGVAFAPCVSPVNLAGLTEASHTFRVRVRDSVGNLDPSPATRTWIVDLTPPETTILSGPSGTVSMMAASFTFSSNEVNVTFACSLDGAAFAACASPFNIMGLAQGPHTFAVRATDAAGHPDPTPATAAWTVDTVAPALMITVGPAEGSTSGPRVTFGFTASEGALTCSVDGSAPAPCASPIATSFPAAPHTFSVTATDAANNSTTVTRSWTVMCAAADPTGASGLLHLDDAGQTLANAVPGGAGATLGDTAAVEPTDPTEIGGGRFGGALSFAAGQHVAWPTALAAATGATVELWSNPTAVGGDLFVSSAGGVAVHVAPASPTTVQFSASLAAGGAVTSAAVAAGAWHFVVASFDPPNLHLWVDGVRTDAANAPPGPLGFDAVTLGGAYSGAIDDVWFAQSAVTTDDAALAGYCPM